MTETERDPHKDAYIDHTVERHNKTESISWSYVIGGGLLILVFAVVSYMSQQTDSSIYQASVLGSFTESQQEELDEAIEAVKETISWQYDTHEWRAIPSPVGLGTVVIMSDNFLWYVEEDGVVYAINGLAKTVSPKIEYAKDVTTDDVFAVLR